MKSLLRVLVLLQLLASQAIWRSKAADPLMPTPGLAFSTASERVDGGKDKLVSTKGEASPDTSVDLYWQALRLFRGAGTSGWDRGRQLLQAAADRENTSAQNLLGTCYLNGGYGYEKDARKAVNWFRLAASRGNAFAEANLGICCFYGAGVEKDHAQAAAWLNAAIAPDADYSAPMPPADFFGRPENTSGDPDETLSGDLPVFPADRTRAGAYFVLGEIAAEMNDLTGAQERYVKAATMGDGGRAGVYMAAVKAAINYAFGKGVPRDLARANEMLDLSKKLSRRLLTVFAHNLVVEKQLDDFAQADVEDAFSSTADKVQRQIQFEIAGSFADPNSKDYDAREAAKWYELAAGGGDAGAMLSLAFLHNDGVLGQADPDKAFSWFKQAAERGNQPLAWADLAICYQNGIGIAKDLAKAAALFKAHRDEDIVCYLGEIGKCPDSILTVDQELKLNATWASEYNDPQAQYLLFQRHLHGLGTKADIATAIGWLKRSALAGNAKALCTLGGFYEHNVHQLLGVTSARERYSRAIECYRKAADLGNADALANLAYCYDVGLGVEFDQDRAIALYGKCLQVDPGYARAHYSLGVIFEKRCRLAMASPWRKRAGNLAREQMLLHYREAERLGYLGASQNLGALAYEGKLVKQDFQEAYVHFDTAAALGSAVAHRMLGQIHENGEGVPITYRDAAYHYRLAALGGDTDGLMRLCNLYLTGRGVSQDYDRAVFWIRMFLLRSAFASNPNDILIYGDALMKTGDYGDSRDLFERLVASQGTDSAEIGRRLGPGIAFNLGPTLSGRTAYLRPGAADWLRGHAYERLSVIYEHGLGVLPDQSKARQFREKALGFDNEAATYDVALDLIRNGKKSESIPLIEKAAERHLPAACNHLGNLYCSGDGEMKNVTKGLKLLREAADGGNADAEFGLAQATLQNLSGSPDLEEAIRLTEAAEARGLAKAKLLREQLESRRKPQPTDASSEPVRAM
jgi:hypothetical protein